jgi:hypothetical protein
MPRYATYPTLFDEVKSIDISDLRRWGYLNKNTHHSGVITWSSRGYATGKISVGVVMNDYDQKMYLDYSVDGTTYNYEVRLTSLSSNLGKGIVWYFLCPFTRKRCRKLHLLDERFMHRSALPSGMYECQTKSKKWRGIEKIYGAYFEADKLYEQLYSKHFKTHYNGKPTKRYLRLMKQINKAERFTSSEIEALFLL